MRNKIIAMGTPGRTAKQRTLSALGHFFFTRGFYQTAIYLFTREIQDRPSAQAYLMRAKVYDEKGDKDKAWRDVNLSLNLSPSHDAYNFKGVLQLESGALTEAEASFNQAIDELQLEISQVYRIHKKFIGLNSKEMKYRLNRGHVYLQQNKFSKASEDFNVIATIQSKETSSDRRIRALALVELGVIAVRNDDFEGANNYFIQARESDPTCAYAFVEQGKLWHSNGQLKTAFSYFSDAIEVDPEYVNAYVQRAFLFTQEKNYTAAYQDYRFALRLKPDNVDILLNLAIMERSLTPPKTKDAIAHLQHADKLVEGKNPEVLFEFGINHLNDPARAWVYFHKALLLRPGYPLAQFFKGISGISMQAAISDRYYIYSPKFCFKTRIFQGKTILDAIWDSHTDVESGIQNVEAEDRTRMLALATSTLISAWQYTELKTLLELLRSHIDPADYHYFSAYALIHDPKSSQRDIGEGLDLAMKAEQQTTSPKYRELIGNLMILAYKKLSG